MSGALQKCPRCAAALPNNPAAAGYCPTCNSYFAVNRAAASSSPMAPGPSPIGAPQPGVIRPVGAGPSPLAPSPYAPRPAAPTAPAPYGQAAGHTPALPYGQSPTYGQPQGYSQPQGYGQQPQAYGQPAACGQPNAYGQPNGYAQPSPYGQPAPGAAPAGYQNPMAPNTGGGYGLAAPSYGAAPAPQYDPLAAVSAAAAGLPTTMPMSAGVSSKKKRSSSSGGGDLGGRVLFLMIGAAFTVLAATIGYYGTQAFQKYSASKNWEQVPGKILAASSVEKTSRGKYGRTNYSYDVSISYSYDYNGGNYQGNSLGFGVSGLGMPGPASDRLMETYQIGGPATIYVNPQNPAESVLERKVGSSSWAAIAAMVLCLYYILRGFGAGLVPDAMASEPGPFYRGWWDPLDVGVTQYGIIAVVICYVVVSMF